MKNEANLEELANFFVESNKLKQTIRYSSCPKKVQEPSAGHSWHVTLMVPIIARELGIKIDIGHAMELAAVHDLAEKVLREDFDSYFVATGVLKKEDKDKSEQEEMERIKNNFTFGAAIHSLWKEYNESRTPEAKFVRALDKLESHFHVLERDGSGSRDDGKHQATYADNAVENFPELKPFLRVVKKKLKPVLEKQGLEWKKEFDYPD